MTNHWTKRLHPDEPGDNSDDAAHSSQLQAALDRSEQLVDTLQETVRLLKAQIHALEAQLPGGPLLQGGQLHGGQFLGAAAAAAPSDAPPGIQQFHGRQLLGAAAPAPLLPPGSPSPPRRPPVCHHHWPQRQNIRSAQLAMDGGWVVEPGPGSDTQITAFFTHLGSTLFSADTRGHSQMWHRATQDVSERRLRISYCTTKANRWAMLECPHCGAYVKVDHGHWVEQTFEAKKAARIALLNWFRPSIMPDLESGLPTA